MKHYQYCFWFVASILTSILFSLVGLKLAFQTPFTIQDDVRQHIFWMQQFSNQDLFSQDLIADYFKSVAPEGFTFLYQLVNSLGIDIFFFNKISTLLISLGSMIYCFKVCLEIFPIPFVGFLSTLLLNQNLWMLDDLSSGTPRAFLYPLFLAFIYYLLRNNLWLCLISIILQGLFYPQTVLLSATILLIKIISHAKTQRRKEIRRREKKRKRFSSPFFKYYKYDKANTLYFLGLITSGIILVFYVLKTSSYEPIITIEQAKLMPEFTSNGRSAFFADNFIDFWLLGRRSGWLPIEWQYTLICSCGMIVLWLKRFPKQFPLVRKINYKFGILLQIIIASTILFFLSHLLLFRLHLPSRYVHHSLRIVLALLDAIAITIILDKLTSYLHFKYALLQKLYKFLAVITLIFLLILPTYAVQSYLHRLGYITGKATKLYNFLQRQPTNYLIATLSQEGDNIPSFAARSVLVAEEYAIPYHQGYYQQIRQRAKDLISAQYSLDKQTIINFINKYKVDLWLVDTNAFRIEYLQNNRWLQQFTPEITEAILVLESNQKPILLKIDTPQSGSRRNRCTVFQTENHMIWKTDCLLNLLRN